MTDQFKETAENLNVGENVQGNLSAAEQAVAEALAERHNAHSDTEHLAVAAFAGEARAVVEAVREPMFRDPKDRLRLARELAAGSAFTAAEAMDAVECVLNAYDKRRIQADALEGAADALCESERLRSHTDDHMGDIEAAADELRRMAADLRAARQSGEGQH